MRLRRITEHENEAAYISSTYQNWVIAPRKRYSGDLKAPMKAISPLNQKAGIAAR